MSDGRLERVASVIEGILAGEPVEPLDDRGDDAIARISSGLDQLAAQLHGGPADRALFSQGPVVVFRWRNEEGWPVEFVSPNVESLTGYPAEEFASGRLPYASLIDPADIEQVGREVADNSASAAWFEHLPYRIRRQDGQLIWVYDYTVVLRDAEGAATHFYGYIMDISERIERDELIQRQLALIDNLGAPIMQVWNGVLTVPLIGRLNEARANVVTDALLDQVSRERSRSAILDLTGVDEIDTSTVMHLEKMIRAVGLLGCECVLSGLSPNIAQTLVTLGVDLGAVRIYRTLAAALRAVLTGPGPSKTPA